MFAYDYNNDSKEETAVYPPPAHASQNIQTEYRQSTANRPLQLKRNGLPKRLKVGIESLSGLSMDDVKVHFYSPRPAGLNALAYTQGTHIHIGPGQEKHLPHEAWHVVQQKLGRVKPTMQVGNMPVNDAPHLESEADRMGRKATQFQMPSRLETAVSPSPQANTIQMVGDRAVEDKKLKFAQKAIVKAGAKIKTWSKKTFNPNLDTDLHVTLTEKSRQDEGSTWLQYKHPSDKNSLWAKESDISKAQFEAVGTDVPLFPSGNPTLEDVKQGQLGDCYLLAAIATLVSQNPSFVKDMIKEVDETHVKVRFFSGRSAFWVTVEKTVIRLNNEDLFAKGALWVQMIEKAYVAGGFSNKSLIGYTYEDIEAGFGDVALQNLTGKKSERKIDISSLLDDQKFKDTPWSKDEKKRYKEAEKSGIYNGLLAWRIFEDKTQIDNWMTKVVKPGHIKTLINSFENNDGYQAQIRLEDFHALFKEYLSENEAEKITGWLAQKKLFPGKRLTGKYSQQQLELINQIAQDISQGMLATAASNPKVARPDSKRDTGTGHSAGEQTSKGLVGSHEYGLVGYWIGGENLSGYWDGQSHKQVDAGGPNNPQLNYVQLYNPWGKFSRSYAEQLGTIPSGTAIRKDENGKLSTEELTSSLKNETTVVLIDQVEQDSVKNGNWRRFWSEKQSKYYWAPENVIKDINQGTASKPDGGGKFWLELSDFTKRFRSYSRTKVAVKQ